MPVYLWPMASTGYQQQVWELTLPLLGLGSNEITVTWDTPWADTAYAVATEIEAGVASIGKVLTDLKAGSRTTAGCVIVVTNTLLVTISAGNKLMVTGVGKLP